MLRAYPRPSVLLVDDDEEVVEVVARLLRAAGHEVHTALGCREGLRVALRFGCDVLVSDLRLGDGDGCDLLRALRAWRPDGAVAVTGDADAETRRRALNAGFAAVVTKPLAAADLAAAVAAVTRPAA
jgi:DNA-binding response OmpR family regulator